MPTWLRSDMTAAEFREILVKLGWSQATTAKKAGMGRQAINAYARGNRPIPKVVAAFVRLSLAHNGKEG